MTPKIFLTGGTGYIGGSVLHTIATAHPEYTITVLLRKTPPNFQTTYPNITILQGDYSSASLLASAAQEADIVIHNGDSDHEPSLNALLEGLLRPGRNTPGHLIHLSGTGIVSDWAEDDKLGHLNPKIWSDLSSLPETRSLPESALHRNTEKILHETARTRGEEVKIAIMCPPDIYGQGKGLGKTHSALIPMFVDEARKLGRTFYYGEGTNRRSWVHVHDLMRVYLKVVEAAAEGREEGWFSGDGYFFAATQEWSQIEFAKRVGEVLSAKGVVKQAEPVAVGLDELDAMVDLPAFPRLGRYLFASNSRTRAERAEALFGYKAQAPGLIESLEEDITDAIQKA